MGNTHSLAPSLRSPPLLTHPRPPAHAFRWHKLPASQQTDLDNALVMLQEACDQGHAKAGRCVGSIYCWGQGVPIDHSKAMAAYEVGAAGGIAVCQFQVGMMHLNGIVGPRDVERAVPVIKKAAAQDHRNAVAQLGAMLYEGQGMPSSYRRARECYLKAMALGETRAYQNLMRLNESLVDGGGIVLLDKRIEICGTKRADMNGKCGVAIDFHTHDERAKARYTVKLDSGETFKVKFDSVRAAR